MNYNCSMKELLSQEMLVLFAILAIGTAVGQIAYRGISIGPAGVLFVALLLGHFGLRIPSVVTELGLLLFVYAVGLEAAPGFFRTFKKHGIQYLTIALMTIVGSAIATILVAIIFSLPLDLAIGLFNGSLTCTPALAATLDSIGRSGFGSPESVTVGYGVSYPFSMIGTVILIQFLPRLLRKNIGKEEEKWKLEQRTDAPPLEVAHFLLTNKNLDGKEMHDITSRHLSSAVISRIYRSGKMFAASPDFVFNLNDIVVAVGPQEELEKTKLVIGEETQPPASSMGDVVSIAAEVTSTEVAGKKLAELQVWELYGVVVTRIKRYGIEINPTGRVTLELGDLIIIVGSKSSAELFTKMVQSDRKQSEETNMLPYLLGFVMGIIAGAIPIHLPSGIDLRFGSAGGVFIMSLIIGHFGKIGRFRLYVPPAAKNLTRSLGLMLFLAGVGTNAGGKFIGVIESYGIKLLLAGIGVTAAAWIIAIILMNTFMKMNFLAMIGALSACMTNPPGIAASKQMTVTSLPTISYASVYPAALIFKIVMAQILVELFLRM